MISTEAVYGPLNSYKDPAIERAFWYFDDWASTCLQLLTC